MVEIDSDIEDIEGFNYFDLDGDRIINMGEMITKLNPLVLPLEPISCQFGAKEVPEPTWKKEANIFGMNPKMTPSAEGNLLRGIVNLSSAA